MVKVVRSSIRLWMLRARSWKLGQFEEFVDQPAELFAVSDGGFEMILPVFRRQVVAPDENRFKVTPHGGQRRSQVVVS